MSFRLAHLDDSVSVLTHNEDESLHNRPQLPHESPWPWETDEAS